MRRLILISVVLAAAGTAAADTTLPPGLQGVDIEDRHGAKLPTELRFLDQQGHEVKLGDYLDGKSPLLLVLAYYQCPRLCSIVLNGVTDGIRGLPYIPGEGFRVLTVSFDPRDTVELAAAKREAHLESYKKPISGRPGARPWDFLTMRPGDPMSIKTLADTVGFRYHWEEENKQFAHAAGAFLFTPDGRLSRTLYGIQFPERDLRLAVIEASEGKLGSAWDKLLLFCYHYDPTGKGYTIAILRFVRLAGGLTILLLGIFLYRLWRRERRRSQAEHQPA